MKLFKNDDYKNRGHFLGWGSSPDADWKIMFVIFLFLLVGVVAYSTWLYSKIKSEDKAVVVGTEQTLIDTSILDRVAETYKKKVENFESIMKTAETSADPSR